MRELNLSSLGLVPIRGDDVEGGLAPLGVALIAGLVLGVVTNWPQIKQGFVDGWNGV